MNKLVKGGLAAAAGIALLMGGAGSLAYWNASETSSSGQIQTGHLTLSADAAGSWDVAKLAPGHTATYTQVFHLSVVGDGIEVALASQIGTGGTLPTDITQSTSYDIDGTAWNGTDTKTLNEGDYTVTATVTVTFAAGATGEMDESYTPGVVTFTATQQL